MFVKMVRIVWYNGVCVCVCACVRKPVDTMCQKRTLYMYSPCQERTSNQEQTHSMSAVGFGIRFGLVIHENPGIDHKIMGYPESALGIESISQIVLYMNESPNLVKTSRIVVCTSHAKCWPLKYWWSSLSSKVCKKVQVCSWWRNCI